MGKKKHKHGHKHGDARDDVRQDAPPFAPAQIAGIAAAALQQVNTPAFRQMMASALGAAAQAFDQRRTAPRVDPAVPPVAPNPAGAPAAPFPPEPPIRPAEHAAYRPVFETPELRLPPEATQAIEQVAAQAGRAIESAAVLAARAVETAAEAVERWASQQREAPAEDGPIGEPPSHH